LTAATTREMALAHMGLLRLIETLVGMSPTLSMLIKARVFFTPVWPRRLTKASAPSRPRSSLEKPAKMKVEWRGSSERV
jgi:hypothetical protein